MAAAGDEPTPPAPAAVAKTTEPSVIAKTNSTNLNADAPAFVPGGDSGTGLAATEDTDESDVISRLPNAHKMMLRQHFMAANGECITYYVGRLKSYNNQNGFGFIDCKQSKEAWGVDVFIHKNFVPQPWNIGQPIEFAVTLNGRGQPQAVDVNWLPRLPEAPKPAPTGAPTLAAMAGRLAAPGGGVAFAGAAYTGGTGDSADATAASAAPPGLSSPQRAPVQNKVERYIGTLKSYAVAQGYGFVACEELFQAHKRDVYLDRSQVPTEGWRLGMCLEFATTFNQRGHPQARSVVWDPIPLVPGMPGVRSGAQGTGSGADQRVFNTSTLSKIKKLLGHLSDPSEKEQREVAVVTAIDFQGVTAAKDSDAIDRDIDYVAFVLDRLGDNMTEAASCLKDFVKMLLLLMIAKMLRGQHMLERCKSLISWFKVLTETINPHSDNVATHFKDVSQQIHGHVDSALRDNLSFADKDLAQMLKDANQMLVEKKV